MLNLIIAIIFAVAPQCTTDDGSGTFCAWDANVQGNGQGYSFVVLGDNVYQLDK